MNDPYLGFDGMAPWAEQLPRGYEIEVIPGYDGWLPHIEITPGNENATYHFIRHNEKTGVYTPGYVHYSPAVVLSLPDDVDVPTWMPVAIERAGFGYNSIPNHERLSGKGTLTHPDQTELVEG